MALRTVKVPEGMEALFAKAEEVVSRFFGDRSEDATRGTIEIRGERYVLVRAASMSVEFFSTVRELYGVGRQAEADDFARNILFDLAHAIGKSDAQNFHARMGLEDSGTKMSAGPVYFSHCGWAFVELLFGTLPEPGPGYYTMYDHPYSFEADAWLRAGRKATFPVCIMGAGYSSGWCEQSFGMPLVASEVLCRARGDEACRFIMAPPAQIEAHVARYIHEKPEHGHTLGSYQIPDFFARKRIEEDLLRRFAEEMKVREAAEKRLRQAHKLEAVGRLAGGIAHDFNNLMAIVITRSVMLSRKLKPNDPMRLELEQITEAGERASNLTQQLLAFSRAQVLKRELLDLNTVVEELARLLGPLIGEDVEMHLELGADVGKIQADRGQIEQVITNLVVNARDAMPSGGRLSITTSVARVESGPNEGELVPGDYVQLTMVDEGRGMDEETLSRIFDPFFTTKDDGGGSGLGLATVYGIVKQSGGSIQVQSAPGKGTRFVICLPRAAPAVEATEEVPEPLGDETGRETILLVEDNAEVRRTVADFLREEGYRVIEASGGETALEHAADLARRIDVLLTDVVMPKMGGRELAARLRTERPDLRVLFMSGYTPDVTLLDGLSGADFIMKPFRPNALAGKLRALLGITTIGSAGSR
jgi:two-component system, cell cycle sensor histidine kinase and response regulator CckA